MTLRRGDHICTAEPHPCSISLGRPISRYLPIGMLLLFKLARTALGRMLELAHDVAFRFAENALHAVAFSTVIGRQHAIWVLQLEPPLLASTKEFGKPPDHGILESQASRFGRGQSHRGDLNNTAQSF